MPELLTDPLFYALTASMVEWAKKLPFMNEKNKPWLLPLLSMAWGVGFSVGLFGYSFLNLCLGLLQGLVTSGLYDVAKGITWGTTRYKDVDFEIVKE